jgi:hypothetical protein
MYNTCFARTICARLETLSRARAARLLCQIMTTNVQDLIKPAPESEEAQGKYDLNLLVPNVLMLLPGATGADGGETYVDTCDGCNVDLTKNVRIKCAAVGCEELDLCPICFCAGREPNVHKAWHDYRVVVCCSVYCGCTGSLY